MTLFCGTQKMSQWFCGCPYNGSQWGLLFCYQPSSNYLLYTAEDKSRFAMTWGYANDRTFIFGRTIHGPVKSLLNPLLFQEHERSAQIRFTLHRHFVKHERSSHCDRRVTIVSLQRPVDLRSFPHERGWQLTHCARYTTSRGRLVTTDARAWANCICHVIAVVPPKTRHGKLTGLAETTLLRYIILQCISWRKRQDLAG